MRVNFIHVKHCCRKKSTVKCIHSLDNLRIVREFNLMRISVLKEENPMKSILWDFQCEI